MYQQVGGVIPDVSCGFSIQFVGQLQQCFKDPSQHAVLQGKFVDAVPLNKRAIEIWTAALGPEHPTVAAALNNGARLLECQVRAVGVSFGQDGMMR